MNVRTPGALAPEREAPSILGRAGRSRALFALLASTAFLACGDDGAASTSGSGGAGASGSGAGASGGGTGTASSGQGGHPPAGLVEPGDPGPGDVTFTVRADQGVRPISPLIYGVNWAEDLDGEQRGTTVVRMGGNRMTAYNWENNASNAGSDYMHQNDAHLVGNSPNGDVPGEAVRVLAEDALTHGAAFIATIPLCDQGRRAERARHRLRLVRVFRLCQPAGRARRGRQLHRALPRRHEGRRDERGAPPCRRARSALVHGDLRDRRAHHGR